MYLIGCFGLLLNLKLQHKFIEKCKWGASAMLPKIEKARQMRALMAAQAQNQVSETNFLGVWFQYTFMLIFFFLFKISASCYYRQVLEGTNNPKLNEDYGDTVPSKPQNIEITKEVLGDDSVELPGDGNFFFIFLYLFIYFSTLKFPV